MFLLLHHHECTLHFALFSGTKLEKLPLLWSAPESVLQCLFSEYSDTYMVGHTILEILTLGNTPYAELKALSVEEKVTQVNILLTKLY